MGAHFNNWSLIGEAASFRVNVARGDTSARHARSIIRVALFKADPDLRDAVDEDVQAIALAAFKARQFADAADLVSAGYSQDVALHFVERLTIGRQDSASRFADHAINEHGEAA